MELYYENISCTIFIIKSKFIYDTTLLSFCRYEYISYSNITNKDPIIDTDPNIHYNSNIQF